MKVVQYSGKLLAGLTGLIIVYFLLAFILSVIPVNKRVKSKEEVEIYILTNGVHTDIILPVRNEWKDWSDFVPFQHTWGNDTTAGFVAFGWGDKNFYLNTPEWSDLKFSTAFNAGFGLSEAALHVTFYHRLQQSKSCKMLSISADNYRKLVNYITESFEKDESGKVMHIDTEVVYGNNDAFYEAKGRYHIFYTCNTWTNDALKACSQKACLWTPFDKGIFYQYRDK